MSSAVAEAEKLRAAGDAHKRDLVQAKLVEREAELASMRDKLRAANREVSSVFLFPPCWNNTSCASGSPGWYCFDSMLDWQAVWRPSPVGNC